MVTQAREISRAWLAVLVWRFATAMTFHVAFLASMQALSTSFVGVLILILTISVMIHKGITSSSRLACSSWARILIYTTSIVNGLEIYSAALAAVQLVCDKFFVFFFIFVYMYVFSSRASSSSA